MSAVADRAYREIKTRIQDGSLPPGERLVERSLCAALGMSRTPVREALRVLTAEGWVTSRPRRGMVVAGLSREELEEIFEVGVVLEAFVASLAARKAGGSDLKPLKTLLKEMAAVLDSRAPDRAAYVELDRRLHAEIAGLAGNKRVASLLQAAMDTRALFQAFGRYRDEELQVSLQQHGTIVRAIESGDAEWAASAMRTHILSGRAASSR